MTSHVTSAEALFEAKLGLIRAAGYPIKSGFWDRRDETELRLLDLADQLHTAVAALHLIHDQDRRIPGPNGEDGHTYWPAQVERARADLADAIAEIPA